ncbi:MAG: FmdB family zinc ribbon protein [Terriglobales bacterium]
MAMYEYQCGACGGRFERLSWGERAQRVACDCGSEAVERIWYSRTAVGSRDQGAGFDTGGSDCGDDGPSCGDGGCGDGGCGDGSCGMDGMGMN